jgi:hypothetical protein
MHGHYTKRQRKLARLLTPQALESVVNVALFVGETMKHAPFISNSDFLIKTAQTARNVFLRKSNFDGDVTTSTHLRIQLLEARLKRLDPVKHADKYNELTHELNDLTDDLTDRLASKG